MLDVIVGVAQIIGSLAGLLSFGYIIYSAWKKRQKIVKVYGEGSYTIQKKEGSQCDGLVCQVQLLFVNNKDEPASITDIIGVVRYNKKEHVQHSQEIISQTKNYLLATEAKPINLKNTINLAPHQNLRIELNFIFNDVLVKYLDRFQSAHLMGFLAETDSPVVFMYEHENASTENLPIMLLISGHIDGEKTVKEVIPLIQKENGKRLNVGTFSAIDVGRIKKDFSI